jgi:hypothetical protein
MKRLINFLKCKDINSRINIIKSLEFQDLIANNDGYISNISDNIIYPENFKIIPEKELKIDVSIIIL